MDEMKNNLIHFNNSTYQENLALLFQKLGVFDDGNASKKTVDRIIEVMQ
jgi:hypothetical protein